MAIGRISGSVLKSNLTRNGIDLAFETNLLYLDVTNSRVGIGTSEPTTTLDIAGALTASGVINANGTGNSILVADTLRIAENGSGLRMTNVGAFDNNSGSFRIFSNNDLIFSSGGDSNTALTIDGTTQNVTINQDLGVTGSVTGKGFTEEINALTSSSTITVNCNLARVHTVTLNTNTEFNITNLPTGGTCTIIITQDGAGSKTATFGTDGSAAVKFPSGSSVLSTGANDIDVVSIFNDGTNFLGNIARNYA